MTTTSKLSRPNPTRARDYFRNKMEFTTGPVELHRMVDQQEDINIIDLRAQEDYKQGHIPGAINLPQEKWSTHEGLSMEKTNILYCYTQQCHLAANAALQFSTENFPVMEMEGGFEAWRENELPIEREEGRDRDKSSSQSAHPSM